MVEMILIDKNYIIKFGLHSPFYKGTKCPFYKGTKCPFYKGTKCPFLTN